MQQDNIKQFRSETEQLILQSSKFYDSQSFQIEQGLFYRGFVIFV